jgi:hypothetical protein
MRRSPPGLSRWKRGLATTNRGCQAFASPAQALQGNAVKDFSSREISRHALVPQITSSCPPEGLFLQNVQFANSIKLMMTRMPFQGLMGNMTSHTKPRKSNVWQGSQDPVDHLHA